MSVTRSLNLVVPIMLLTVWLLLVISFDFLSLNLTGGWESVPQNFLFGFMLIPEVLVAVVTWGIFSLL